MSSDSPSRTNQDATLISDDSGTRSAPPGSVRPGTVIGNYRIERYLGEGGMGVVYLAHQAGLDRQVVIKFLKPDCDLARFQREAKAVARIDHPHVVKIIELGEIGNQTYMVLEYLANGDLSALTQLTPPTLEQLVGWLRDCLAGLDAIHRAGMIHRDIKPQNIFIDAAGRAKIGDLGLAKTVQGEDQLTMQQGTTGTPAFLSPEQARSKEALDIRTDIYSLGASFYSLLTGRRPFDGSLAEIFSQVLNNEPMPIRSLAPTVPMDLARIIATAMQKDRAKRYATPAEMLTALNAASMTPGTSSGGLATWLLVGGAVAVLAVGAVVWVQADKPAPVTTSTGTPASVSPSSPQVAPVSAPVATAWFQHSGQDDHGRWAEAVLGEVAFRFRLIPAGDAHLGSPADEERRASDEAVHTVNLPAFWISQTEITQAQWLAITGVNPSRFSTDPKHPVERVSWDDAQAFVTALSQKLKTTVQLPSEDQWEYAARAGSTTAFTSGASLSPDDAVFDGNFTYAGAQRGRRHSSTQVVAGEPANAWGLFDVHGNVAEWCSDELPNQQHPIRGGSWSDPAWNCRSAARFVRDHTFRHPEIGLRVVITAPQ